MDWRPSASVPLLRARASLLAQVRAFFAGRGVLEVETPLLCRHGVTDPALQPLQVSAGASLQAPRYLQTSPEYAMKRLLAAGSGPIYQVCRAFRDGEAGSRHNPEFTLLEWYRPGFALDRLMDEVAELLGGLLGGRAQRRHSYRQLFLDRLQVDPMRASAAELEAVARRHLDPGGLCGDRNLWLDLLMSHLLEAQLDGPALHFVTDYPAAQAALARRETVDGIEVARRFELYVDGLELANGYEELLDPDEQRRRFLDDNARRREHGLPEVPLDEALLAALEHGLPACSGVALGLDRLLMLVAGCDDVRRVVAFDWERA